MPDQEHLILVLAREAEEITRDMYSAFRPARRVPAPSRKWPHRTSRTELPPRQPATPRRPRPRPAQPSPPRPGRVTTQAPVPGIHANRTRLNR